MKTAVVSLFPIIASSKCNSQEEKIVCPERASTPIAVPVSFRLNVRRCARGVRFPGLSRGLQGGFKGPDLREGFRKHEGGLKGAWRRLEGGTKGA